MQNILPKFASYVTKSDMYPFCPMGWSLLPHGWGKKDHFNFIFLINISQKSWYIWIFWLFPYILCKTKYQLAKLHSCTYTGMAVIPFWKLSDPSCPTLLYYNEVQKSLCIHFRHVFSLNYGIHRIIIKHEACGRSFVCICHLITWFKKISVGGREKCKAMSNFKNGNVT